MCRTGSAGPVVLSRGHRGGPGGRPRPFPDQPPINAVNDAARTDTEVMSEAMTVTMIESMIS